MDEFITGQALLQCTYIDTSTSVAAHLFGLGCFGYDIYYGLGHHTRRALSPWASMQWPAQRHWVGGRYVLPLPLTYLNYSWVWQPTRGGLGRGA